MLTHLIPGNAEEMFRQRAVRKFKGRIFVGKDLLRVATEQVRTKLDVMRILALSFLLVAATVEAQFAQQGAKLRGTDAAGGDLGTSVAISFDGNTAVAGGPMDHSQLGATWIFTRNGKVWSQRGPRLVGTDSASSAHQGSAVAVSADGNTVLVGGPLGAEGSAWIFTRTAGMWSQQGSKLVGTGAVGEARQGSSAGLSADGNTAIIGGPADNGFVGAAWIFTRSGGTWTQQGSKLVGIGAPGASEQGYAVALSGDGNTAIIGSPSGTDGGSAWIFTRTGDAWAQQGSKWIGIGAVGTSPRYGAAVALSYDGNTAIVGASNDAADQGAAWIYVRTSDVWVQQGNKLVGNSENAVGRQGTSVSLSSDGDTAVSGGPLDQGGAVWAFLRSLGIWTQQGSKLVGTGASIGGASQGRAVAISGNATTIIEAGSADSAFNGAVWPFARAVPTIATTSGDGQSAQIETAFAPLAVIVRDATDQPSSSVPVTFAVTTGSGGATGAFGASATVLTNANGIATAPTLTANSIIGGFTVTATTATAPASATFNLANATLATPTNVTATATATPTISVTWNASSGATLYEVWRSEDSVTYTLRITTSETFFVDSSSIFNNAYLYKVRAVEPGFSGYSAPELAAPRVFTDTALNGAMIKAAHFTELRQAVHIVRALARLDSYPYIDSSLSGEPVKAVHLTELRAALDEARARLMLPPVLYTRAAITAGSTVIARTDVLELRSGVQ